MSRKDRACRAGYKYTGAAVVAILLSAVLGLLVSLSTFLVIGATSSLSYNVIGHVKVRICLAHQQVVAHLPHQFVLTGASRRLQTVIILTGGCLLFGDEMPLKKLAGISLAMCGIVWYSILKLPSGARQQKVRQTDLPITGDPRFTSRAWRKHGTSDCGLVLCCSEARRKPQQTSPAMATPLAAALNEPSNRRDVHSQRTHSEHLAERRQNDTRPGDVSCISHTPEKTKTSV